MTQGEAEAGKGAVLPRKLLVGLAFQDDPLDDNFDLLDADHPLIEQAIWYCQRTGASVTFTHVVEENDHRFPGIEKTLHEIMREKVPAILEKAVGLAKHEGVAAQWDMSFGTPWYEMIQKVKADGYDMVMVGPRCSDSFVDRVLHGSTARRLMRKCPCPVWVTTPDTTPTIDRVLVPMDFTPLSEHAVAVANAIHALTGAERYAVHCPDRYGMIATRRMPDPDAALAEYHAKVRAETEARFQEFFGDAHEAWNTLVYFDAVERVVNHVADSLKVDIVVMGSVARTGLAGWIMGNTAEKVLLHLESPVLVLKPEGWAQVL